MCFGRYALAVMLLYFNILHMIDPSSLVVFTFMLLIRVGGGALFEFVLFLQERCF